MKNLSNNYKTNLKEVKRVKKWSKRKKRGLRLVLILPITTILRFLTTLTFRLIRGVNYTDTANTYNGNGEISSTIGTSVIGYYGNGETTSITTTKNFINWILGLISLFGLIGFIPGLTMLLKLDTDYNPNIELETSPKNLNNIYINQDTHNLSKKDIENMKYNGFISKLNIGLSVILNILTFGIFSTCYYGLKHSDLPKIKEDDFLGGKAIGFLFIPFYNIYRIFVFWLRLVDRINFQYIIRDHEKPISRGLTIATLILNLIPYLNYFSIFILQSILVGKIQKAINGLVDEHN